LYEPAKAVTSALDREHYQPGTSGNLIDDQRKI